MSNAAMPMPMSEQKGIKKTHRRQEAVTTQEQLEHVHLKLQVDAYRKQHYELTLELRHSRKQWEAEKAELLAKVHQLSKHPQLQQLQQSQYVDLEQVDEKSQPCANVAGVVTSTHSTSSKLNPQAVTFVPGTSSSLSQRSKSEDLILSGIKQRLMPVPEDRSRVSAEV